MFQRFERMVHPYPDALPPPPPKTFFAFLWACAAGVRPYLLWVTVFTAGIGAFEALLFSMMAHVVDVLAQVKPAELWQRQGTTLLALGGVLLGSIVLAGLQALLKYQAVYGNFPMRLRWNFHRLLLEQSMSFYQDEFAGRIATKVMQTALAVRDCWLIVTDILVYVVIYFVTMVGIVGAFDLLLVAPFATDSVWMQISKPVTMRICRCTVVMNSCIAPRAKAASRRPCEKSLTVAMFVYASVTRPVISERASACSRATLPRRGT